MNAIDRNSPPKVFSWKKNISKFKIYSRTTILKSNFNISIKFQSNFIETTLGHECSPVNLLHIFSTPFPKNNSGRLLRIDILAKTIVDN